MFSLNSANLMTKDSFLLANMSFTELHDKFQLGFQGGVACSC